MGAFSFKSVGQTSEEQALEPTVTSPPVGIKTPLELGTNEGIFAMHLETADQIHDNLRNLLMTNWGDRLVHYDLGANLRKLTTEYVSLDDFDTAAITNIKNAVSRWMPFVDLNNFISEVDTTDNQNTSVIRITILYNVPALNITNRKLQVVLYVV